MLSKKAHSRKASGKVVVLIAASELRKQLENFLKKRFGIEIGVAPAS
jgi:uncharacterized protein (DUF1697 family)